MPNAIMKRLWSERSPLRTDSVCALFIAVWCGLGSILGRFAPNLYHRHVGAFWWAPRWHDLWFLVLFVAIAIWCARAAVCLLAAGVKRWRFVDKFRDSISFALLRLVLVVALGTYAWLVVASPGEEFAVTQQGVTIHGEFYRALRIETTSRDRQPRQLAVAWLERRVGTATETLRIERGTWWSSRVGSHRLALAHAQVSNDGAVIRHGGQQVTLRVDKPVKQGLLTLLLRAVGRHRHHGTANVRHADIDIDGQRKVVPLDPEWPGEDAFLGMRESPVLLLRVHRNLTVPLLILSIVLLVIGAVLRRVEPQFVSRANE